MKAYLGDPADGNRQIYGELQIPLSAGIHTAGLIELLDMATAVGTSFVSWLYDEGALQ
jgi:hypothetical protein